MACCYSNRFCIFGDESNSHSWILTSTRQCQLGYGAAQDDFHAYRSVFHLLLHGCTNITNSIHVSEGHTS
jgi:hypothetical protein